MSDSRFHLKVVFEVYGKEFEWDSSLNWSAEPGECDERISGWFSSCYENAYAEFQDFCYRADAENRKKAEELAERAELARLSAKYHEDSADSSASSVVQRMKVA